MGRTGIDYLDEVWNPVHGCLSGLPCWSRCWARRMAHRLQGAGVRGYERGFTPTFDESRLNQPLSWRKPRRIGVNFMGDTFVDGISNEQIASIYNVMATTPRHTYCILTKRPERMVNWYDWVGKMRHYVADMHQRLPESFGGVTWPLSNVWVGVSVMRRVDLPRLDWLRRTPAVMRYVSFEPLLENPGKVDWRGIGWCVVGCESGYGARPMEPGWARTLKNQSTRIGIAFYLKQMMVNGKLAHAPFLDGRRWQEIPEMRP